ncbi:MAG: prephenate dehydratase [Deltaproteobacteria bacterium]|nr:prephenate dehydratase [Deltaproteobacteria bacterium]
MRLEQIRAAINKSDRDLISLLAKRMELAIRTRPFKKDTLDTGREEAVIKNAKNARFGVLTEDFVEEIIKGIMSESRKLQDKNLTLVAFQGEHGAYSEIACRQLVKDNGAYIPNEKFRDVFEGVEMGAFDVGIVPVENSLEGAVTQVNNLLVKTKLKVIGETVVRIDHCLMAKKGTDPKEIKIVYSHPQALGQCAEFINKNNLEARPYYDTAGAAKMIIDKNRPAGAIASPLCADFYGLEIIQEHIEDDNSNQTRFLMLSKEPLKEEGNKCSLVFSTTDEAGQLLKVLSIFADNKINLTRIASMPNREDHGNYNFFLDFEGSDRDPAIVKIIEDVKANSQSMNFLGCYKAYKQ